MAVATKNKKTTKSTKVNVNDQKLNPRMKLFCTFYTQNSALFGNATMCYAQAYEYQLETLSHEGVYSDYDEFGKHEKLEDSDYDKAYNICSVEGARLLRIPKINEYINTLLNQMMTNTVADGELAWIMTQRVDLGPKIRAIAEFNKLKNRIIHNIEINTNHVDPKAKEKTNSLISNFLKNA